MNNAINQTYHVCCNETQAAVTSNCKFLNNLHADCATEEQFKSSCISTINKAINPIYGIFITVLVVECLAILVGCCITCLGDKKQSKYHNIGDDGTDEEVVGLRVKS